MMEVLKIDEWLSDKPNKQFVFKYTNDSGVIIRLKDMKVFRIGDYVGLGDNNKKYLFLGGKTDLIRVFLLESPLDQDGFFKEANEMI